MSTTPPIRVSQLAEQGFWYGDIVTYIQILLSGNAIQIFDEASQKALTLTNDEGWEFISEWAVANNFSFNKKYSRRHQANNLLADIANRQGLEKEAAKSFNSLRQMARTTPPPTTKPTITTNQLWKDQIRLLEAGILGKLSDSYATSRLLQQLGNKELATRMSNVLAANPEILGLYERGRASGGPTFMARVSERVHDLIVESDPELEPLASTFMSDQNEALLEESLRTTYNVARSFNTSPDHPGLDVRALQSATTEVRRLTQYGNTLTAISDVLHNIDPSYLSNDVEGIDIEFRRLILQASGGSHVSGGELINELVRRGTISAAAAEKLSFLAPQLELVETSLHDKLRHPKNAREKLSYGLATTLGIDPSIFWLKEKDLNQARSILVPSGSSLEKELQIMAGDKGTFQDPQKLQRFIQLNELHDRTMQYATYRSARSQNTGILIQDIFNKSLHRLNLVREPYEEVRRRVWAPIEKIDDFVRSPFRKTAEYWQGLIDGDKKLFGKIGFVAEIKSKTGHILKIPLLNLPGFAAEQYRLFRLNLGKKTFEWSWKLAQKGGVWSVFKPISNYSWSFVQHGGDFREANSYFIRKGFGNFLDWGAQRFGFATFAKWKSATGKAALAFGNKITGGLLGKATAYLASIGLSVEGIGLVIGAITVAIDLTKMVIGFIKKFFTDENFRNKILTWAPAIGLTLGSIGLFISGLPAAIAFGFMTILGILEASLLSLAALFVSALVWASITIMSLFILYFGFLLPSTQIDPGTGTVQIVSDIVCTLAGTGAPNKAENPRLSAGKCIFQLLSGLGLNPLNKGNANGPAFNTFAAKLGNAAAAAAAKHSATEYLTFQCSGFDAVVDIMTGGKGEFTNAFQLDQINPPGYDFVGGITSCAPGDFFVDKNGTWGHTGLFVSYTPGDAEIICMDANSDSSGTVRDETTCRWKVERIAGCLKKR